MRAVVLQVWCDVCDKEVEEADATNIQLTVDGLERGTYETDLCPSCLPTYMMPTRVVKPTRKSGEHPCDECEFVAKTVGGLGLHKNKKHGESA